MRAQNINTIDEVPDSSWFTNRIGTAPLTDDELMRGPNVGAPPDPRAWIIIREKTAGVAPGLHGARTPRARPGSSRSTRRRIPKAPPARSSIATKFFWALGYNQVENVPHDVRSDSASTIDPTATVRRPSGKRTPIHAATISMRILERVARRPDGTYRVVAGRLLPGKSSADSATKAPGPTIPTTSSRTSTGASCARCASSARGRTSPT